MRTACLALASLVFCSCITTSSRFGNKRTVPADTAVVVQQQSALAKPTWTLPLHTPFADVLVARNDGKLLVGALSWDDDEGRLSPEDLLLVDGANGNVVWRRPRSGDTTVLAAEDPIVLLERDAKSSEVIGVDATGRSRWKRSAGAQATAAFTDDTHLLIADSGNAAVVDITTGTAVWTIRAGGDVRVVGDTLLMFGAKTTAIDVANGRERWTSAGFDGVVDVLATDDAFVIADKTTVRRISKIDGSVVWSATMRLINRLSLVDDESAMAVTGGGAVFELQALDLAKGKTRWTMQIPVPPSSSPIAAGANILCSFPAALLLLDNATGKIISTGRIPLAMVADQSLPDALWTVEDTVYLRRERGIATFDAKTLALGWWLPVLYSNELQYARYAKERENWVAEIQTAEPQREHYARARIEQSHAWSSSADRYAAQMRSEKSRVFADPKSSQFARTRSSANLQGAIQNQMAAARSEARWGRTAAALDLANAGADFALALMESQLADYQNAMAKDRYAMVAASNTYIDVASRYLNSGSALAVQPVMHRQPRLGIVVTDPSAKAARYLWIAPRIDNDPPLAILSPDEKSVYAIAAPTAPEHQEGLVVRERERRGVALSAFPLGDLEPFSDPRDAAEKQGGTPEDIDVPRLIVDRKWKELYRRYSGLDCASLRARTFAGGSLLDHAMQANDAELIDVLQNRGYALSKGGPRGLSPGIAGLQFPNAATAAVLKIGAAPVPSQALLAAIASGRDDVALGALKAGASANAGAVIPRCESSALQLAVAKNATGVVEALLKAGAWTDYIGPEGTALDVAEKHRASSDVIARLKKAGAKRAGDVDALIKKP